jgi:hypothetical protein
MKMKKAEFQIPKPYEHGYTPTKFVERNLAAMQPTDKNQLPPTEAEPLRQHYRMAGGCK